MTAPRPASARPNVGPPPPLDRELAPRLAEVLAAVEAPLRLEKIADARRRSLAGALSDAALTHDGAYSVRTLSCRASDGAALALVYCRAEAANGALFHIHGGGMVAGSARSAELANDLARAATLGLSVFSADYRLAPEHPHPTPVEDCYALLTSAAEQMAHEGLDPARLILSGNSAGGGIAASLALMARDRGGPALAGVMLQCPMLDDRCDTVSAYQMEAHGVWDTRSNRVGWRALLAEGAIQVGADGYAAAARATDLGGLAPVFIDVGAVESLRDEALAFAKRLWGCGGSAELHVWAGAFHSFDQWVPDAAVSGAAEAARRSWLVRVLGP